MLDAELQNILQAAAVNFLQVQNLKHTIHLIRQDNEVLPLSRKEIPVLPQMGNRKIKTNSTNWRNFFYLIAKSENESECLYLQPSMENVPWPSRSISLWMQHLNYVLKSNIKFRILMLYKTITCLLAFLLFYQIQMKPHIINFSQKSAMLTYNWGTNDLEKVAMNAASNHMPYFRGQIPGIDGHWC